MVDTAAIVGMGDSSYGDGTYGRRVIRHGLKPIAYHS